MRPPPFASRLTLIPLLIACVMLFLFTPACTRSDPPLAQRAMAAYNAHDYQAALPLLKQYATTPEVRADPNTFNKIIACIVDAEKKISPDPTPTPAAPQVAPLADQSTTSEPPARTPHAPPKPGEILTLSIKELGNFDFDPLKDDSVPPDVQALNGARLRLRGFMVPWNQAEKITEFALVPSLTSCCFGQPPGTQHIITCHLPKSRAVEYSLDEISVEGYLKIDVKREDNYTYSIFELNVTSVKTAS